MTKSVYHFSAEKMRTLFGNTFSEFAKQRLSGLTPSQIVDETFFKPAQNAIGNTGSDAVLNASLNPVSPCHVLAFPAPESIGAKQEGGSWTNMPADGDFLSVPKEAVLETMRALYDWTVSGYKQAPELKSTGALKQSFWTANLGKAAYLAVPLLHVHHLMVFDEETHDRFKEHDPDTGRFIRPLEVGPEFLLRRAFEDKHGADAVGQLQQVTDFISISDMPDLPKDITITRPARVKVNDFAIEFTIPERHITADDIQAMTETAYDVQKHLSQHGVAGYTMVMDTTALQKPDGCEGQNLSMYFVAHMQGDPEWLRGGFVYTAQKYTAPNMQDLML